MIDVICLDTNLTIKDCNDWREYFYNISKLGDVSRVFIVKGDLGCIHDEFYETHVKSNLPSLIREHMAECGYCNFTIEMDGLKA